MTTIPRPANPTLSFAATYDAWNRLVGLNDGTATLAFEYDGLNRRMVKSIVVNVMGTPTTLVATHFYFNAGWQVLESRKEVSGTEDPDPLEQIVWHPYYVDALATRFYDKNVDGILTGTDEGQHYFTHDANFNVTAAVDDSGIALERYHYTPYGELTVLESNFMPDSGNLSDIENPYTYAGRRLDTESGLYQYRNRYYHAQLGRFANRDPIGYEGSLSNLYEYVGSMPLRAVDPSGNFYWVNSNGDYCGPYVKIYTGSWCVKPNVWDAAINAAARVVNCWVRCEIDTHTTICGEILTATEVVSWTVSLAAPRVPKLPHEILNPNDIYKNPWRQLAQKHGHEKVARALRTLARSNALKAAKTGVVVTALIEAGISIHCGIKCSQ